jgi:hypothetical protein
MTGPDPSGPAHRRRAGPDGTLTYRFELVPLESLLAHERIERPNLEAIKERIRKQHLVDEPLLVAEVPGGRFVVLNGHHRRLALMELGARRAPAWVVDYAADAIVLDHWPGAVNHPTPTKQEVVEHALRGELFPPKTTRHRVRTPLPTRVTHLSDLR